MSTEALRGDARAAPARVGTATRARRRDRSLLLFLLPGTVVYVAFLVIPALGALGLSFTDWDGVSNRFEFLGLGNYRTLAGGDPTFGQAVGNNLKFTVSVLVGQTLLSLLLALMLVRNTRPNLFYRALFFLPTVVSSVSVALAWLLMYEPSIGAINVALDALGLGGLGQSWLGNGSLAIFSLAFVQFWQHTGQVMIIFIAGLQAIPPDLYEAADVEGANRWQRFRYITLPLLAPAAAIVVAYTTIQSFKAFDLILALTDGGPSFATEILSTWIYHAAFRNFEFGFASAGAVVFMIALGLVTWLQFRVLRTRT